MNRTERAVAKFLRGQGYDVYRNGWPDFLAVKPDPDNPSVPLEVIGVEAKSRRDRVSSAQGAVAAVLHTAGIPVHVVRELEVGYERMHLLFDDLMTYGGARLTAEDWRGVPHEDFVHPGFWQGAL